MWDIIILAVSQVVFGWSRTKNVQHIASKNIIGALITSTITKTAWLITTFLGLKGISEQDWTLTILWLISGVFGDYLAMINFKKDVIQTRSESI